MIADFIIAGKKIFTVALFLLVSGCIVAGEECLQPGEGTSSTEKSLKIPPAYPLSWVNTGVSLKANETVKSSIFGTVNLCSGSFNTATLQVHGNVCADGTTPRYPTTYPYDINLANLCPGGSLRSDVLEKTDSGIIARNGDIIRIELVPYKLKITSCDPLTPGVIGDVGDYDASEDGSSKVSFVEICKNGGVVYIDGVKTEIDPYLNQEFNFFVADVMSPEGNKYFHTVSSPSPTPTSGQYWHVGAMLDLRLKEEGPALDTFDCNQIMAPNSPFRKVLSTEINKKCGSYCPESAVTQGDWTTRCVSTMHYIMGSTTTIDIDGTSVDISVPAFDSDGNVRQYLQNLDMHVGGTPGTARNGEMRKYDVNINGNILVEGLVDNGKKPVFFHYWDPNGLSNFGGYNIKVTRTCEKSDGEKLYGYIGANDPSVLGLKPGDPGTFLIGNRGALGNSFVFNGDNPAQEGTLYLTIDTDEPGSGEYNIYFTLKVPAGIISALIKWIMGPILDVFRGPIVDPATGERAGGVMRDVYNDLLSQGIRRGLVVLLAIYISTSFLLGMIGAIPVVPREMMMRFIKIGFFTALISDYSWEFFSAVGFDFFLGVTDSLIEIFANRYYNTGTDFGFLDSTIGILLNAANVKRILSLLLAGPMGWLYCVLILLGTWEIISASALGVIIYCLSIVALSVLIACAPIFISFMLINQTKQFFDKWIKLMCLYSLQPAFVFAMISICNDMQRIYIMQVFNFGVCRDCLIGFFLGSGIGTVCMFIWFYPMSFAFNSAYEDHMAYEEMRNESQGEHLFGLPVSLQLVIQFYILTRGMKMFVYIAIEIANSVFGTIYNSVKNASLMMSDDLKSVVGQDKESVRRRKQARALGKKDDDGGKKKREGVSTDEKDKNKNIDDNDKNKDTGKEPDAVGARKDTITAEPDSSKNNLSDVDDNTRNDTQDNSAVPVSPNISASSRGDDDAATATATGGASPAASAPVADESVDNVSATQGTGGTGDDESGGAARPDINPPEDVSAEPVLSKPEETDEGGVPRPDNANNTDNSGGDQ